MPRILDKESGRVVGTISDNDLQFLVDQFEEESSRDRDYYIDRDTLDMLEAAGAGNALLAVLRDALGARDSADIVWQPDGTTP